MTHTTRIHVLRDTDGKEISHSYYNIHYRRPFSARDLVNIKTKVLRDKTVKREMYGADPVIFAEVHSIKKKAVILYMLTGENVGAVGHWNWPLKNYNWQEPIKNKMREIAIASKN